MFKDSFTVLGVMSGTSLDGIDLACVYFEYNNKWNFEIKKTITVPYSEKWKDKLQKAVLLSDEELINLNKEYTAYLAATINGFIENNAILDLDFVSSHGHTVKHEPQNNYTLQIGNLPELATLIKQSVVCDFRVADVLLGGQGAPLVPIGDALLFSEYDYCINLGGFSNISFEIDNKRIAFDISALNTVLNFYASIMGFDYDDKGNIAKKGILNEALLHALNDLAYYKLSYPKSLGIEYVNNTILPLLDNYNLALEDVLRTFTEHAALQIAAVLKKPDATVLLTGGGAYNDFLISRIAVYAPNAKLIIPKPEVIEFKEALVFAFLGILKVRGEINVLASVTGAAQNHSSGIFYEF